MIIDTSYFYGLLQIPNIDNTAVRSRLEAFIEKFGNEFLNDILGDDFAALFLAGIAAETVDVRWSQLLSGGAGWKGLVYEDANGNSYSAIANYVYYNWMDLSQTSTTAVGEVKVDKKNAGAASAAWKMVEAWEDMLKQVEALHVWLNKNYTTYPEFSVGWNGRHRMGGKYAHQNVFGI